MLTVQKVLALLKDKQWSMFDANIFGIRKCVQIIYHKNVFILEMTNSQRRLFGRLTISLKICVMFYRTVVLKEISSHFSWLISYIWHRIFSLLVPPQLCLKWGSPNISAGAAALCYTQDLTGANHPLTCLYKQVQFRWHQIVAAVSPSWAFSLWRDLKLSLRHIRMEAGPPTPT